MEFKELQVVTKYVKFSNNAFKVGDTVVEGEFVETYIDETYEKPQHKFSTTDGPVVVPGAGQLNYLLKMVKPGDTVRIVYNGIGNNPNKKKGHKDPHNFKVLVASGKAEPGSTEPDDDNIKF